MKYDALHNRQFLETIFDPESDLERVNALGVDELDGEDHSLKLPKLRELYHLAKVLFEYVRSVLC
jgi:hypothetical protein